jgi:hypothetical protein
MSNILSNNRYLDVFERKRAYFKRIVNVIIVMM